MTITGLLSVVFAIRACSRRRQDALEIPDYYLVLHLVEVSGVRFSTRLNFNGYSFEGEMSS